jgi:outer membrane protein assembly factor BamB
MRKMVLICAVILPAGCSTPSRQPPAQASTVSVWTQHNDNARTGANLQETVLNVANVNREKFGKLFEQNVDGDIYGQPLYLPNVNVPGKGLRNMVYVATMHNTVYAFDADQKGNGDPIWVRQLGVSVPTSLFCEGARHDIHNEVGIVSTPVISINRHALYLVAFTLENGERRHYIHALDLASGEEKFTGPKRIAAEGFAGPIQNQRPGLLLANDTVYVGFGAYADCGPFHGWMFGFNADTLEPMPRTFDSNPVSVAGNGIWQAGQGPAADASGNVYVVVGNGTSKDTVPPLRTPADKISFNEQAAGHPAATALGGRLLIAWTAKSTEGASPHLMTATWRDEKNLVDVQKLEDTSLDGPTVASGDGHVFLAWTENDSQGANRIYVRATTDLKNWNGNKIPIPDASSVSGPALAFGRGRLFLAWTDKSKNVVVRSSADGIHWYDGDKFTLEGPTAGAPQLAYIDDALFLLSTDANHVVSLMQSEDGKSFSFISKKWRSQAQPSLIKEGPFWLAWTGASNGTLGLATGRTPADLVGNEIAYQDDYGSSAPALAVLKGAIFALWTSTNGHLNIARFSEVPAFANSFVKLRPDLSIADWFTVWNTDMLNRSDVDLGSAGPLLLPGSDLVMGGGKEGKLYLLQRNNLGGFCPPAKCGAPNSDTQILQWFQATTKPCLQTDCGPLTPAATFHHIHGSPVYWDGPGGPFIYIWGEADFLRRFKFENGKFVTAPVTSEITTPGRSMPGAMLSLSANGNDRTSGIIWASHPTAGDASASTVRGTLRAMDASTLKELWNSDQDNRDALGYVSKFAPVTIANGKVYAATFKDPTVENCSADACKAKLVIYAIRQ